MLQVRECRTWIWHSLYIAYCLPQTAPPKRRFCTGNRQPEALPEWLGTRLLKCLLREVSRPGPHC